jgi:hypothetical protein
MQPVQAFADDQYEQALDSWSWLDLTGKSPQFASLFGDLFLESPGGWWFLDTIEGVINQVWRTGSGLQHALNTPEGQDQYLLLGLGEAAERRGVTSPRTRFTHSPRRLCWAVR